MPTIVRTVSMPLELSEKVRARAHRADRSFSAEVREAIKAFYEPDRAPARSDRATPVEDAAS